jgi:trehalose/maltose hydrolase-like predicted phosphorylase
MSSHLAIRTAAALMGLMLGAAASPPQADWAARVNSLDAMYCSDDSAPLDKSGYPEGLLLPLMGNGYLSHGQGVRADTMYLSGIFNGETTSPAHRARLPAPLAVTVDSAIGTYGALLDMEYGTYARRGALDEAGSAYELRWYAHRSQPHLYVMELDVTLGEGVASVTLQLSTNAGAASEDIAFESVIETDHLVMSCGNTTIAETSTSSTQAVCMAYTPVPSRLTVDRSQSGETMTFIMALASSLDRKSIAAVSAHTSAHTSADVAADASLGMPSLSKRTQRYLEVGMQSAEAGDLLPQHKAAWAGLWTHGLSVEGGRSDVALAVNASLYAILSSVRAEWPEGLAPGGLTNGYNGHSFWDTETWMFPPVLLLHADIASGLMEYRYDRLGGARAKALSYDPPFAGAMFAWESAATGVETCPMTAPTGAREQHISADIAFAVWQYWLTHRDEAWLRSIGNPILQGVAEFVASKAVYNGDMTQAHINDIIPPDEYVDHVNDSVYTNYLCSVALKNAVLAGALVGGLSTEKAEMYTKLSDAIVILFNETLGIHPEYEGYGGELIKQADVVLLAYPLGMEMTPEVQRANLDFYSAVTDTGGPAMTWGMHSIGYRDLMDLEKAEYFFEKSFADHLTPPFNVWSEALEGAGAANFITGAGGFLQTVLSGYADIRISATGDLTFAPLCLSGSTGLAVRGLSYLGAAIDVSYACNDEIYAAYPTEVTVNMTMPGTLPIYLSSQSTALTTELRGFAEVFRLSAADAAAAVTPVSFRLSSDK